jgi:eukaryotic-like serine/threonine-protein kinase
MKIGRYEKLVKIGCGGMGVIYKAYDPSFKETVALKTMSSDLSTDPKFREKFFEEGCFIKKLRHENIVQIFNLDEDGGQPYLTMELLEGNNLKERMYGRDRMPLELKLRIMMEICKGLAYAHEMGIIHRDIKPENIFVTRSEHVKILDFGLARATAEVTQGSKIFGTMHYMSPEHWQKKEDHRSDIFAAGAVFYELLTLKKAFDGDNPVEVMGKVREANPEPIHKINPTIPEQLSAIILKALSKNPDQRYPKMDVFLGQLEEFAKSLEERKDALQKQNVEAVGQLSSLIAANKDLLRIDELEGVKQSWPFILRTFETVDGNESKTIYQPRQSYLELMEDCEKARHEYDKVRVLVQKRRETSRLLNEARELMRADQFEAARQALEWILQDDPVSPQALSLLKEVSARIEERRQTEKARRVAELYEQAVSLSSDNDLKGCLALLDEVLRLEPDYDPATALREEVQRKIKEQLDLEERGCRAQEAVNAGRLALTAGDLKLARDEVERALAIYPEAPGVSELRGDIEVAAEQLRLRSEREDKIRRLLEQARVLYEKGEYEEALARVVELMALDPAHQQAVKLKNKVEKRWKVRKQANDLFDTARLKYSSGDLGGCSKLLNEVLKLDPGNRAADSLLEEVQQKLKQMTEITERRHHAEQALSAALSSLAREDIDQARFQVGKALSAYPEYPSIPDVVSQIERVADKLVARREREEQVRRLLEEARSLAESGDEAMALDRLKKLLKLEPSHIAALRLKLEIETRRQAQEDAKTRHNGSRELETAPQLVTPQQEIVPENDRPRGLSEEVDRRSLLNSFVVGPLEKLPALKQRLYDYRFAVFKCSLVLVSLTVLAITGYAVYRWNEQRLRYSELTILSQPANAEIYVNAERKGIAGSPIRIQVPRQGRMIRFFVRLKGYDDCSDSVTLKPNQKLALGPFILIKTPGEPAEEMARLDMILQLGDRALADKRFTDPEGDSAFDYANQLLEDANRSNQLGYVVKAKELKQTIEREIQNELDGLPPRERWGEGALALVESLNKVNPSAANVQLLQQQLQKIERDKDQIWGAIKEKKLLPPESRNAVKLLARFCGEFSNREADYCQATRQLVLEEVRKTAESKCQGTTDECTNYLDNADRYFRNDSYLTELRKPPKGPESSPPPVVPPPPTPSPLGPLITNANDAESRGDDVLPLDRSAIHWALKVLELDPNNAEANTIKDRSSKRALQKAAQLSVLTGLSAALDSRQAVTRLRQDLSSARDIYNALDTKLRASQNTDQISALDGRIRQLDELLLAVTYPVSHRHGMGGLAMGSCSGNLTFDGFEIKYSSPTTKDDRFDKRLDDIKDVLEGKDDFRLDFIKSGRNWDLKPVVEKGGARVVERRNEIVRRIVEFRALRDQLRQALK